jgi:hypothetical protein
LITPRSTCRDLVELTISLEADDDGRGWVRTSDLSRVKGDEEGVDSGVNPVDKPDSGEGG